MLKSTAAIAFFAVGFFILGVTPLSAQDMASNGNFELQALGAWSTNGQNTGALMVQHDVTGGGTASYCWERTPGTNGGNGGLEQNVLLVAGVTYQFDAVVKYYTC
jgi:hypothetical protein